MIGNGRIRVKKIKFSMVSNEPLDSEMSLAAKGLYSLIQRYITIDKCKDGTDFVLYKSMLEKKCKEGQRAFNSAWKELKEFGYLKMYKIQTSNGFYYEYELLENSGNNTKIEKSPTYTKCTSGKRNNGERKYGKSMIGESNSINKNEINNNKSNNTYINHTNNVVVNEERFLNAIENQKSRYDEANRTDEYSNKAVQYAIDSFNCFGEEQIAKINKLSQSAYESLFDLAYDFANQTGEYKDADNPKKVFSSMIKRYTRNISL